MCIIYKTLILGFLNSEHIIGIDAQELSFPIGSTGEL